MQVVLRLCLPHHEPEGKKNKRNILLFNKPSYEIVFLQIQQFSMEYRETKIKVIATTNQGEGKLARGANEKNQRKYMSTALSAGKVSEHVTIGTSFHLIGWYTFCGPITVLHSKSLSQVSDS